MRSILAAGAIALAAGAATPAGAQADFTATMIAITIGNMRSGMPAACLLGRWKPTPEKSAKAQADAEPALRRYLDLAAGGAADMTQVFTNRKADRRWALDGTAGDLTAISDPWAKRVVTLRLRGHILGGEGVRSRAVWDAVAADGSLLGTYDAVLRRTSKGRELSSLDLYSPGSAAAAAAKPIVDFCYDPGDIEDYKEAVAKADAEREAKRAAERQREAAAAK
jgi:hypothetical protein